MYNDLAGAMYEQEEKKKSDMFHRRKVLRRRICAVIFLLILLSYFVILLIDTGRYKNGLKPLITIKEETKEYDDGTVKTYYSLGWIFREYNPYPFLDSKEFYIPFFSLFGREVDPITGKEKLNNDTSLLYQLYEKQTDSPEKFLLNKIFFPFYLCLLSGSWKQ